MSRSSLSLSLELTRRFRSLERTRSKIEHLASTHMLSNRDIDRTYEGLFLSAYSLFERFIEDLFIGLLVASRGLQSSRNDLVPRITVSSHKIAREVILGSRRKKFVDWLPYEKTSDMASIYFRGGRPFSDLDDSSDPAMLQLRIVLTKAALIRNALAHKSRHSLHRFREGVIGGSHIPAREKSPASYLRGRYRTFPAQTRYENLVSQLAVIARHLSK